MQKNQLLDALKLIQDENTVIRGTFEFDREFSATYECRITSVTLTYSKESRFEAVIHFQEVKEAKAKEEDVVAIAKVKNVMTKDKLLSALTLLDNEDADISTAFTFDDPWSSSSYKSYIYGVKLQFNPDGIEVVICTKEAKEEAVDVAA